MDETEPDDVVTVGQRLKEAREAKGLSVEDIAAQTRIPTRHLTSLEDERMGQAARRDLFDRLRQELRRGDRTRPRRNRRTAARRNGRTSRAVYAHSRSL